MKDWTIMLLKLIIAFIFYNGTKLICVNFPDNIYDIGFVIGAMTILVFNIIDIKFDKEN